MNKWTIAAVALVLLVVAGFGALYYVAGTPQYSLYLLKSAVADHDRDAFKKYFDIDRVVTNAVEREVGGRVPAGPQVVSQKAVDTLVPASKAVILDRLDERFDAPASAAILDMKVDSVRYQNQAALVTLKDPNDGSTTVVTLERTSDRKWKVVDLDLKKADIAYTLQDARDRANLTAAPELPSIAPKNVPMQ